MKKLSVSQLHNHSMIIFVSKSTSLEEFHDDLNDNEMMSERINSDAFLISEFLLDSFYTSKNKSIVS